MVETAKSRMSWLYVHLIPQANSTLYSRYILKVQWFDLKTTLFNFFFLFQILKNIPIEAYLIRRWQ